MQRMMLAAAVALVAITAVPVGAQSTTGTISGRVVDPQGLSVPGVTVMAVGLPGTTSTATSVGTPVSDSFYRVSGLDADRLRPHVGHRIELQGQLTDNTPGIESTRAKTTQDKDGRATTTVDTRIAIAGVLHATTLKMVSADCK